MDEEQPLDREVNQTTLASIVGVTPKMIAIWATNGLIPFKENPTNRRRIFSLRQALRAIDSFRPGTLGTTTTGVVEVENTAAAAQEVVTQHYDYKAARTRLVLAQAKTAELKHEQMLGILIPRADTIAVWTQHITRTREMILSLPARIVSQSSGIVPPEQMAALHAMVTAEVRLLLSQLADTSDEAEELDEVG